MPGERYSHCAGRHSFSRERERARCSSASVMGALEGVGMRKLLTVAVPLVCIACVIGPVAAQTSFTRLSGIVRDASGAVMPGATVTLTRVDSAASSQTFTNDQGSYLLDSIIMGF